MKNTEMLQKLREKFSASTLEQIAWLETRRSGDITTLSDEKLERVYYRFFPKEASTEKVANTLAEELELKRLRSIVLADAQFMGLYYPENWMRFNNFMRYRSVLKKPLNAYKITEFNELIKQFKSMRTKFINSKMKVGDKQWYTYFGLMEVSK